jgi:precorrin-3B synthase
VAIGLGFRVGHTQAVTLDGLLRVAHEAGATGVRTAPGRALLIIGMTPNNAVEFTAAAKRWGFVIEPRDPGRRIVACAGAPICGSGEIEARALAAAIARGAILPLDRDEVIHISGCAKCCAYQRVATLTAIGRDGRCDLFVEGAPAGSCLPEQLDQRLGQLAMQRIRDRHG